jgi:hypothetical protein
MESITNIYPPSYCKLSNALEELGNDTAGALLALQRQNTEISKQIFPEKEYRGLSPNFHIHVSVSDLYIPTIGLPIPYSAGGNM